MSTEINFTLKAIDSIKPAAKGKRTYYRDSQIRGLELMVTDKGTKSFKVTRKKNGRLIRVTLGYFPELNIQSARKRAHEINALISDGKNPNEEKRKISSEKTFGALFEEYMERYSKKHKRSWRYDEREVHKFLSHWFNRKISSVSNHEVRKLHERIRDENGLYQANRMLERIRSIYNRAIDWGWEGANPASGIKKYKETSRDRFLLPEEMPRFMEALEAEENQSAKDFIKLCLLTGARRSNVLMMRWEQISFERKEWRIPETKNGEPLRIPLSQAVIFLLKERIAEGVKSEWVLPSIGKHGYYTDPKKAWERLLKRADIKDLRIHDLRRTFGSYQAATGANGYIIGKSLGHKSQQSTAVYARLNLDPVRHSVELATEAMLNAAENLQHAKSA